MNASDYTLDEIPKLGFGFMRLPQRNEKIDMNSVCQMVDSYMKNGFIYFDTAYVYHNGESETVLRQSLVERYPRESFLIADKLPAWVLKEADDVQRVFDEQLARTGAGYFDFYLLHCVDQQNIIKYDAFDCFNWAQKKKKNGQIRHFGFSFHDKPELLDEVLSKHPEIDFVQLQINYADWESESVHSRRCYETARKHGKPIIIMEPVKGGTLASLPPACEEKFKTLRPENSIASWALRFCGSLEGILVILSGMSSPEQMKDNLNTMKNFVPLNDADRTCLEEVKEILFAAPTIACTSCSYCTDGCPEKIKIPKIFSLYNSFITYGKSTRADVSYQTMAKDGGSAVHCIECGQCESICPQHLPIIETLKKADLKLKNL